jgi:hypothetical protein
MSRKRTSLRKVRKLINGHMIGITSSRELGEFAGISHSRVQVFLRLLGESSYSFEELAFIDDEALSALIHPSKPAPDSSKPLPDFERIHDLLTDLPETILSSSRRFFDRQVLWKTEEALHAGILAGVEESVVMPEVLWFFVCGNWDVYANLGTLEEWWCLGNLCRDGIDSIIRRFERDETVGLMTLLHRSPRELAERYGNPRGRKVYSGMEDLLSLYRGEHCEREWRV